MNGIFKATASGPNLQLNRTLRAQKCLGHRLKPADPPFMEIQVLDTQRTGKLDFCTYLHSIQSEAESPAAICAAVPCFPRKSWRLLCHVSTLQLYVGIKCENWQFGSQYSTWHD